MIIDHGSSLQTSNQKIEALKNTAFLQDQQLTDRSQKDSQLFHAQRFSKQRGRRIATANENYYAGCKRNTPSRGAALKEIKADMMSQTQQNLNKLRMTRACQSNMNMRKALD